MSNETMEMRRYVDERMRQSPAYQVLCDELIRLDPRLVPECEVISAELLAETKTSLRMSHDEAVVLVDDLTLDNPAAVNAQIDQLACLPDKLTRSWRSIIREENDQELCDWARCMVARLARLYLAEAGLLAAVAA